jgi:single-strand DNA-binding protein
LVEPHRAAEPKEQAMSLNTLIITGNLGSDPRFALTPTGKQKASFSIATSRVFRGQKHTEWTPVVLWGTLAALAEKLLTKGQAILIHGEKRTRSYTDTHGVERQVVELVASDFQVLGRKQANHSEEAAQ